MEKIIFVKNDDLREVNEYLEKGWKVKDFKTASESVSCSVTAPVYYEKTVKGNVYAYFVLTDSKE